MYAYLDRPVSALDEGGRVLTWGMRRWVRALEDRQCPVAALGAAFARRELMPALAPFHRVMSVLSYHARQPLSFAPLCCPNVSEGEALLLAVIASARTHPPRVLDDTLNLLVDEERHSCLREAMQQLAEALATKAMIPAQPGRPPRLPDPR